jgi:hypothetical protein
MPLRPDHRQIGLGHRQIGARHVLVALRLLGALDRGDIALRQPLLPAVRRLALRQNCAGAHDCGIGLGEIGLIGRHRRAGARHARLLFGRMQGGEFLATAPRIQLLRIAQPSARRMRLIRPSFSTN